MTGRAMTPERFWKKVEKSDGCWLWKGQVNSDGYGAVGINYKTIRAHRAAWIYVNGPVPDGMMVLHRCDVPLCVRPDHLFIGSAKENTRDMVAKGRSYCGARNHLSKVTPETVVEIRRLHASGRSQRAIAKLFGLTQPAIGYICRRDTWKEVA